jgi:hypothetical protein
MDRTFLTNRPDIALLDKTCLLIDITLPNDSNTNTKETEKKTKRIQRPGD